MNIKDERIAKLYLKGLSITQIARKIGNPLDTIRVEQGLVRKGLLDENYKSK